MALAQGDELFAGYPIFEWRAAYAKGLALKTPPALRTMAGEF